MNDIALANLETLVWERLDQDALAKVALQRVVETDPARGVSLAALLRHHGERPVRTRRELDLREGLDRVLALYALLEIGSFARTVPDPLPGDVRSPALHVITNKSVITFYEDHYPIELVTRFRERLLDEQNRTVSDADAEAALMLYRSFLDIDRQVARDPDVQTFQWMLDDMWWDGVGLPDLRRVCRSPARFGAALAGDTRIPLRVRMGTRGLLEYFEFAVRFDDLLRRASAVAGLCECFWLYYSYWFRHLGRKFRQRVDQILSTFEKWSFENGQSPDVAELREVMQRLLAGPVAYEVWARRV